jgi:F-type H+-transporting ATPase subunit a
MAGPMEQFEIKPWLPIEVGGFDISFTNQSFWMVVVVLSITLFLTLAVSGRRLVPSRMQSLAELSYEFVANMINTAAGQDGLRFFPFIFALFLFILISNMFGLIPGAFTVTSQIAVTFGLTAVVILLVLFTGFAKHGFGFFKLFVPAAPAYMLPLLVPLEVISFCTRPLSLSVRLFANMLAGHTMLKVMAGFVVALGGAGLLAPLSLAPMAVIIAVTALEILVAFLQAYVFAILSCIYLGEALHLHDNH